MTMYRKTALIEAVQYLGQHVVGVCHGGRGCGSKGSPETAIPHVHTLEGDLTVAYGDWIATGVQGEHWPIKPDVFAATYALVNSDSQPNDVAQIIERYLKADAAYRPSRNSFATTKLPAHDDPRTIEFVAAHQALAALAKPTITQPGHLTREAV